MNRFSIILLFIMASLGCAGNDIHLDMPFTGLDVPIRGGKQRSIIVVKPFLDHRQGTSRCGMVKNPYDDDTADALCKTGPGEWMAQLLADELRASQFSVSTDHSTTGPNVLVLQGAITKLFVEPVWHSTVDTVLRRGITFETDLQLKLTAKSASGLYAERRFFVKGLETGTAYASVLTPYHRSLKHASEEMLTKILEAVFFLMNKYPRLGKVDPAVQTTEFIQE